MRAIATSLCLLLSMLLSGFAAEAKDGRTAAAEIVAQQYMTALFHGEFTTVVSLTHPDTLQRLRSAFVQEHAAAVTAGVEAEFLAQSDITAWTDLDALKLADFYVAVLSGSRRKVPEDGGAAMKTTVVTIKGSEPADAGRVVVALAITLPGRVDVPTENARLALALVDNQWKVVGNGP